MKNGNIVHLGEYGGIVQVTLFAVNYDKSNSYHNVVSNEMRLVTEIYNDISWKFDFIHDYKNKGSKMHAIESNGKKLVCNCDGYCRCFFVSYSFGMKPQSGKYKIKIKINNINNGWYANIIGIISQHSKNNKIIKNNQNYDFKTLRWWNQLDDYIGWSACGAKNDELLPNGLYCGSSQNESSIKNNIIRRNNFLYSSNNKYYPNDLPRIESGDIIQLSYDSNNGILSFNKENDNGKLNAQISNLPKENTYFWFVGQARGKMCLSLL